MALSEREFRRRGYSQEDIDLAKLTREAQRRTGAPLRSLSEILTGKKGPRRETPEPADLTGRQLRQRGPLGQAALLIDQAALSEKDLVNQAALRSASHTVKEVARIRQLEFDFFKGNRMTADEFHDEIRDRLKARKELTVGERSQAIMVLGEIIRWLPWQQFTCSKSAAELADVLEIDKANLSRLLKVLEEVGAIRRVKRGRTKVITVTPEGAYRGNVHNHAETVDRYKAEVFDLFSGQPVA